MSEVKKGIYRHYKGKEYEVLEIAKNHDNDKDELVIYRSLEDETIWSRSKKEFLEKVELDKKSESRFKYLRDIEVDSSEQKYLRALADYQNLLKQSAKDKLDFAKFALEDFLHELLPVYDHLKLSIKSLPEAEKKNAWVEGVQYVIAQFKTVLENRGVVEIETSGKEFNHEEMEALDGEGTKVKSEVMPGYKLHGKVIRAAKVIVE